MTTLGGGPPAAPAPVDLRKPDGADESRRRPSPVAAGELLAGRYRLIAPVPSTAGGPAVLWRATDEVLARTVAVTVLPARSRTGQARPFLEAAARTGPVLAPGLARTYDAALEERTARGRGGVPRVVAAYVISEWVEGRSLAEVLLADGPFPPADAVALVEQAAEALTAVHAQGLAHGRVTPGNLLLGGDGRLRVTGTAVAAVAHGQAPAEGEEGVREDTRGLALVLYALLTARWPGDPARGGGLPPPPMSAGRPLSPRQVRAGVPRALDVVVARVLDPGRVPGYAPLTTPRALAEAAAGAVVAERPEARTTRRTRRRVPPGVVRALPWVASVAVVTAIGVAGYQIGLEVGDLEPPDDGLVAVVSTTASPKPGAPPAVLDLQTVTVQDFDPEGNDRTEQRGEVPNAYDGDRGTAWSTDTYRTERFGGLKEGVGLLVDLGKPTVLERVEVNTTVAGATLQLRGGNQVGDGADSLPVLATAERTGRGTRLVPKAGTSARYWLLWVTGLPRDGGGFRVGVEELRLLR